jgi:hypothetical protein
VTVDFAAPPAETIMPRLKTRRMVSSLPHGWPLYFLFYGYPLWWALGLQAFIWPLVAIPLLFSMIGKRSLVAPRGFGVYLMFLAWVALSLTQLSGSGRILAYAYRGSLYVSAGVIMIYAYNCVVSGRMPLRNLVFAVTAMWWWAIAGGFLGLALPNVQFTSLFGHLMGHKAQSNALLKSLLVPGFGDDKILLGYKSPRPKAPFNYTNEWGSNLAILTMVAIYATTLMRRRMWRNTTYAVLALSIIPIIVSINRGLWLSLGVGIIYVTIRLAGRGKAKYAIGVATLMAVTLIVIIFTPLGHLVTDRFNHANTQGRSYLYQQASDSVSKAPLLGYGAPLPSADLGLSADASVGTHGQMWTLLVSQGYPGAGLFVLFLLVEMVATWRVRTPALWLHAAILVMLVQLPYYNVLPVQLQLIVVIAVCARREVPKRQRDKRKRAVQDFSTGPLALGGAP